MRTYDAKPYKVLPTITNFEVEDDNSPDFIRKHYKGGRLHRSTQDYEFIAWDGEGVAFDIPTNMGRGLYFDESNDLVRNYTPQPQPYVLLGHSKGGHIVNRTGLGTIQVLNYLLDIKELYPKSIFVGFSINYDINQWLKDLPMESIEDLLTRNRARIRVNGYHYYIRWLPRKMFGVSQTKIGTNYKRSMTIYDTFGFFQTSFLNTCRKYLGSDDRDLELIEKGKDARALFTFDELDEFIIPYNMMELKMLVKVMNILRDDFHGVDIYPGRWHGPGAIANDVLKKWEIPISRDVPKEVLDASQYAYAGGRFEQYGLGRYEGAIYEYDIRSAYPAAATHLPNLSAGTWEHVKSFEPGAFGVWRIGYKSDEGDGDNKPQPLFCRSEDGRISYPSEVFGWFWTPEARFCADSIQEGWVFRPSGQDKPFAFIEAMYEQRRILKLQGNSTERALKLILNSIYGKLAQVVGSKRGRPPTWHQLEYAGYITSYTRAKIYEAILLNPEAIIAVETDAVFSKEPLDLPLSENLGDWEKKEYIEIVYLQSGFYYATTPDGTVVCRFRGMDRDRKRNEPVGLPYGEVLDHLRDRTGMFPRVRPKLSTVKLGEPFPFTAPLSCSSTRFVGAGFALNTNEVWRSWDTKKRWVSLDQDARINKRYHLIATCPECQDGKTLYDCLHTMQIGGYSGISHPSRLPWREIPHSAPMISDYYAEYLSMEEWDRFS